MTLYEKAKQAKEMPKAKITSEMVWAAIFKITKQVEENPITTIRAKRSSRSNGDGDAIKNEEQTREFVQAPLLDATLRRELGVSEGWITNRIRDLEDKKRPTEEDGEMLKALYAWRALKEEQLMTYALIGQYEVSLVKHSLNIRDKKDITSNDETIIAPIYNFGHIKEITDSK